MGDSNKEFWVDRAEERAGRKYVTGRVLEGPISINDEFRRLSAFTDAKEQQAQPEPLSVELRVVSIVIKVVGNVQEIDSPYTGELELDRQ